VPANFMERTGRDHWEVLLRARAIENGAWVIAPSQIGGPTGYPAFGRSMVIDPWGTIVAQAPDAVSIVRAELDIDRVAAVRRQIPSLANRRSDTYGADS
jgi:predicted amidohydrolase